MQRRTRIAAAFIAGLSVAALAVGEVQEPQTLTFDELVNVLTLDYFGVNEGATLTIDQPANATLLIRTSGPVTIEDDVRWTGFLCIASSGRFFGIDGMMNGQWTSNIASGPNARVPGPRYILLGYSDNPTDEELLNQCGG